MKHILYSAFMAVVMLVFAACTNDEIEILSTSKVDVVVPTAELYSNLGPTAYVNFLGNNNTYSVGVKLLVYNENGELVKEDIQTSRTLTDIDIELNTLPEGKYNVVALQTMIDASDQLEADDLSEYWTLVNKGKLSTLRIDTKADKIFWYGTLGVANGTLTVTDRDSRVRLTPSPVGFLMDLDYENMASTDYVELGFFFHNAADGLYLDPSRTGSDKIYYDNYNGTNTWSPVSYFYNNSGLADKDGQTVFLIGQGESQVCFGVADATQFSNHKFSMFPTNGMRYTFEWGKYYQAFAIYNAQTRNFDYFLGNHNDFDAWYQQYTTAHTSYFAQPTTNWGTTVYNVKSFMNGYTMGNANGALIEKEDGSYVLWYKGKYKEEETDYYFSSSTGGLYRAYVFVKKNVISEENLATYIKNLGYTYAGKTNDGKAYVFESADQNTCVQFGENDEGVWYVCFFDVNNSLNKAPSAASIKRMSAKH